MPTEWDLFWARMGAQKFLRDLGKVPDDELRELLAGVLGKRVEEIAPQTAADVRVALELGRTPGKNLPPEWRTQYTWAYITEALKGHKHFLEEVAEYRRIGYLPPE